MASIRRLAAILAADLAVYSRLMGADEEGTNDRTAHKRRGVDLSAELASVAMAGSPPSGVSPRPRAAQLDAQAVQRDPQTLERPAARTPRLTTAGCRARRSRHLAGHRGFGELQEWQVKSSVPPDPTRSIMCPSRSNASTKPFPLPATSSCLVSSSLSPPHRPLGASPALRLMRPARRAPLPAFRSRARGPRNHSRQVHSLRQLCLSRSRFPTKFSGEKKPD